MWTGSVSIACCRNISDSSFYDTGQLFPEFAANIGGGQNIYNFSYYGLYSPLILPSYFLPFLKMSDYMIAVSLLCLLADVLLFL